MKGKYSLFQMWEPFRRSLVAGHLFYVEQAKKRLLSQFSDIEAEANQAAEQWLEENDHRFNPDFHSPGDFEEQAFDAGLEFYELLKAMQARTRLSVVAGMYHEWDKQLHQWMEDQMRGWCSGTKFEKAVWKTTLTNFAELVEPLGWDIRSKPYYIQLDACRLVVNVYKHGNGDSLTQLKQRYPEYLLDSICGRTAPLFFDGLSHKDLSVCDYQFQAFSDAIESFWRDVPAELWDHDHAVMPAWLSKALGLKGSASRKKQGSSSP